MAQIEDINIFKFEIMSAVLSISITVTLNRNVIIFLMTRSVSAEIMGWEHHIMILEH